MASNESPFTLEDRSDVEPPVSHLPHSTSQDGEVSTLTSYVCEAAAAPVSNANETQSAEVASVETIHHSNSHNDVAVVVVASMVPPIMVEDLNDQRYR